MLKLTNNHLICIILIVLSYLVCCFSLFSLSFPKNDKMKMKTEGAGNIIKGKVCEKKEDACGENKNIFS